MRAATIVFAATVLAGSQAAVVPREVTTTSAAATETATEIPTTEALTTITTVAIETTTETPTVEMTTSAEAESTEAPTAAIVITSADCAQSTVPHSAACVKKWFHAAGCLNRELPADMVDSWLNNEDVSAIEGDMVQLYANATATGDAEDKAAFIACAPLPKPIMQVFDCVDNVMTDTCATCFSPKKFLGVTLPTVNGTCLGECFHNEADKLASFCPNLNQAVTCHDTLKKTCGKCMEKKGNFMGMHVFGTDDDCFECCYWANKDEIRSACPLPEPLKKAVDCHQALAEQCGEECVDEVHEVDVKCLDGCYTEKSAQNETLKEMCPERMAAGLTTLSEMMPTDDDMEYFFEQLLSNVELPFNLDIESLFANLENMISKLPKPDGHHDEDNNKHDHHDDDDEDDDDDHHENGLAQLVQQLLNGTAQGSGELQTAIDNILGQVLGGQLGGMMGHHDHDDVDDDMTETTAITSTPTETDGDDDVTETAVTSTPTETDVADDVTETATSIPTDTDDDSDDTDDDDDEFSIEDENPLLSFLESFISKILNF